MIKRPDVPAEVLGRQVPERFRRRRIYLEDPGRLVTEVLEWVEQEISDAAAPADGDVVKDRETLVRGCIELLDLVRNEAAADRLVELLSSAGIDEVGAPGEPFDSSRHAAVGRAPAPDPSHHNRIAEVQTPGFVDRGQTLQPARVVVYRQEGA